MFNNKKNSHLSIELNDYVLRAVLAKGPDIEQVQVFEVPLDKGIVEAATILNEMELFSVFKEHVAKWGGKRQNVRIFVPDTSVLLRTFQHPQELESNQLKSYVEMELGLTIHLPFQDPLIDVYDHVPGDGQAVMYAAPSEEVSKMIGLLLDIRMQPEVADIRALSNVRLLEHMSLLDTSKTYLIADWSINELSICIFSQGNVEFLRYQTIETDMTKWHAKEDSDGELEFYYNGDLEEYRMLVTDQVLEIDRMMNFFKFSLHKGEKAVDEILIMGDNPLITKITNLLSNNITTPLTIVDDAIIQKHFPNISAKYASLLGLALKEVH